MSEAGDGPPHDQFDDDAGQQQGPAGPAGGAAAVDAEASGEQAGGEQDENQLPTDEQGFPTVADPDGDDLDNTVAPKSKVVKLARKIPVVEVFPRNPYSVQNDTTRHVRFFCDNLPRIGMEAPDGINDFNRELFEVEERLRRLGYEVGDGNCKFQFDPNDDRVMQMGKYERRISDKRLVMQKIVDSLTQAEAILSRDKELNEMEANLKRQSDMMDEMRKRLDKAEQESKNPSPTRSCLVCMKKTPELLDVDKEVRRIGCSNRGICTECWTSRTDDVVKFFPDRQRPKHCFSCVTDLQNEEMDLYCEEVQSACGTLQDDDARQIVLEQPWFWKISQARSEKPDTVLAACDLIRYPRTHRFLKKSDDTAFKNLATAASAMQKSSHELIAGTMDKKIIANTYQHIGFKTLFGTTKKGAPESSATNVNLEGIEQFFRELADGYSKFPTPTSQAEADKHPYQTAVWLCQEALFMIKCARDDFLGRTYLSFSELSSNDRAQLEQMIRCSVYIAMREDRKSLKKGSLLTKTEKMLYAAKYVGRIRQLELRAVQKLIVTGSMGGSNGITDLKAMEKRLSSLQSTTDKLSHKISAGGVRASLSDTGGDPNNPTFGNIATWDYDTVSKLPAYLELKQNIEMLSAEDKQKERKDWCNSSIRTNPKMVMYCFDTFRGRHMPGCRNCWAEKGGDPPMHAYTACRSLRNPYYLICPHCSREHPEWPDACPAAPPRGGGNGGSDGGNGRGGGGNNKRSGGGNRNNKKQGNRPHPYKGQGASSSSNTHNSLWP